MANVILVVDMIEAFCRIGNLANPRAIKIIPKIENLLQRKEKEGWKIIFLADNHKPNDEEFKMFPIHAVRGTEETKIVWELRKFVERGATVIPKTRYSGFYGTDLEKILAGENPEIVIMVGVCTDICVHYTVADLGNRNYNVIVPRDAVETYDTPEHDAEKTNKIFIAQMKNILGVKIAEKQEEI